MKIKGSIYEKMRAAMRAVVETAGGPAAVKAAYAGQTEGRMLWDVWHSADRNLRYGDDHPGFSQGHWTRVHPQDASFDVYADPTVMDSHILTALKAIGRGFGLL